MRVAKYFRGGNNKAEADVPETWEEAYEMIQHTMKNYNDRRGGNNERLSVACRIAFGMFNKDGLIPDPTTALLFLMQKICQRKGAGLDK